MHLDPRFPFHHAHAGRFILITKRPADFAAIANTNAILEAGCQADLIADLQAHEIRDLARQIGVAHKVVQKMRQAQGLAGYFDIAEQPAPLRLQYMVIGRFHRQVTVIAQQPISLARVGGTGILVEDDTDVLARFTAWLNNNTSRSAAEALGTSQGRMTALRKFLAGRGYEWLRAKPPGPTRPGFGT